MCHLFVYVAVIQQLPTLGLELHMLTPASCDRSCEPAVPAVVKWTGQQPDLPLDCFKCSRYAQQLNISLCACEAYVFVASHSAAACAVAAYVFVHAGAHMHAACPWIIGVFVDIAVMRQ